MMLTSFLRRINDTTLADTIANFTVLIKNYITFPSHGREYKTDNLHVARMYFSDSSSVRNCRYNQTDGDDRYCPYFRIGDMVRLAGQDYHNMSIFGGVIIVNIVWEECSPNWIAKGSYCRPCNLDWANYADYCKPRFEFSRADHEDGFTDTGGWYFK